MGRGVASASVLLLWLQTLAGLTMVNRTKTGVRAKGMAGTVPTGTPKLLSPVGDCPLWSDLQGPAKCSPGPRGLPCSPPAGPQRLSPPLCPPALTAPRPWSWWAGRGPEGLGGSFPICVFGLQPGAPREGEHWAWPSVERRRLPPARAHPHDAPVSSLPKPVCQAVGGGLAPCVALVRGPPCPPGVGLLALVFPRLLGWPHL